MEELIKEYEVKHGTSYKLKKKTKKDFNPALEIINYLPGVTERIL